MSSENSGGGGRVKGQRRQLSRSVRGQGGLPSIQWVLKKQPVEGQMDGWPDTQRNGQMVGGWESIGMSLLGDQGPWPPVWGAVVVVGQQHEPHELPAASTLTPRDFSEDPRKGLAPCLCPSILLPYVTAPGPPRWELRPMRLARPSQKIPLHPATPTWSSR